MAGMKERMAGRFMQWEGKATGDPIRRTEGRLLEAYGHFKGAGHQAASPSQLGETASSVGAALTETVTRLVNTLRDLLLTVRGLLRTVVALLRLILVALGEGIKVAVRPLGQGLGSGVAVPARAVSP